MTTNPFVKAVKSQVKLRLALDGPSGSGKTYTALIAATVLAKGGKIAVIDTERKSSSLYSDKFSFDAVFLDTFSPKSYIDMIKAAEENGYAVIVIDSLSHAWEGEGGALDMVDAATRRSQSGNSYTAWKDVTPIHRKLIDAMLQSPCHIIATMRTKVEYVIETNDRGKSVPRKVGMAPIQRQGMEYEFTIVGDMDTDHNLIISKSRCDFFADKVENKPSAKFFEPLMSWLNSGAPVKTAEPANQPAPAQPSTGGNGHEPAPAKMTIDQAEAEWSGTLDLPYGMVTTEALSKFHLGMSKAKNQTDEHRRKMAAIQIIMDARSKGRQVVPQPVVEPEQIAADQEELI
jgi:hypothetical protein